MKGSRAETRLRKVMSDFSFNIASSKPVIRETANMNNDGGGGNLGYMSQGEKEDEKKKYAFDESIFSKKNEFDSFVLQKDLEGFEDEGFFVSRFVAKIIFEIKKFFNIK